ncbi:DUF4384 domain-containing protein [Candidatus Poribacteria bacterium]|nr:DUF4384 domain-containing protein [Candidatus Poribacteria bacterium]
MRKYIISFVLLISLFFALSVYADNTPDWVRNFDPYQKYPADKYLAGFGTSSGKDSEAFRVAKDNARAAVSRAIVVDVDSMIRTVKEEDEEKFSQHLSSITQSSTALQIMGLDTETYAEDSPPTVYAVAYVSKADLGRIYARKKTDLIDEISRIISDAQKAERDSRSIDAATKYLSLYPLYQQLKEAETVLLVVGEVRNIEDAFSDLNKELGQGTANPVKAKIPTWTEVRNKIDELLSQDLNTVEDVARSVIIQLSKQAGDLNGRMLINSFSYQDTKMGSPFSRYFKSALENQLVLMSNLKWDTVKKAEDFTPKSANITADLAKASGAQWVLSGTYWEQGDKIKIMASLNEAETSKILAGADVVFDKSMLEAAHLSVKPQNYQQAIQEQEAFKEDQIISGNLTLEVWTNKGNEDLIFNEGEVMKVRVRVNRPAYVRLLYIIADGKRSLLYDNYYIDSSRVNHVVEIPEEFECAPPFGAEMLVAIARTTEFPPIEVINVDGYDFLATDTAKNAAYQSRGMIRKKQKPEDIQQTEAKIVITTME